jgi:ABC-type sulfate transport system substrate-binding protein
MAGKNTNAYGTPEYNGFNDVHPTRGEEDSEHWKTSNVDEKVNLKQSHLSSAEYQKAKKLKGFNADDWVWNSDTHLYDKVEESNSKTTKADRLPLFEDFQG